MSKVCSICNKNLGLLDEKVRIGDGYACIACWSNAGFGKGIEELSDGRQLSSGEVSRAISLRRENQALITHFRATKKVSELIAFDDNSKAFLVYTGWFREKELYKYSQILNFDLLEDNESVLHGGLGRAVAGGLLFGPVGAIVGGVTGRKKQNVICNSLKIKITLRNAHRQTVYIDLIETPTQKRDLYYKTRSKQAQEIISALQIAVDMASAAAGTEQYVQPGSVSVADEIRKLKQLCDEGVITPTEFQRQKEYLLKQ